MDYQKLFNLNILQHDISVIDLEIKHLEELVRRNDPNQSDWQPTNITIYNQATKQDILDMNLVDLNAFVLDYVTKRKIHLKELQTKFINT